MMQIFQNSIPPPQEDFTTASILSKTEVRSIRPVAKLNSMCPFLGIFNI